MAETFNVHEAKTRLSQLIDRAEAGEEIVIARANKPVVKLVPVAPRPKKRIAGLGAGKGRYWMSPDFDAPLPDEFWLGTESDPLYSPPRRASSVRSRARRPKARR